MTLEELHEQATSSLQAYLKQSGGTRADTAREVADFLVQAREYFVNRDGDPDYRGQSGEYRRWASSIYDILPASERSRVMGAIRHHISPALRARVDADTLSKAGFKEGSTVDYSRNRSKHVSRIYSLFGMAGPEVLTFDDASTVAAQATMAVKRIHSLPTLEPEDAELIVDAFDRLAAEAQRVSREVAEAHPMTK